MKPKEMRGKKETELQGMEQKLRLEKGMLTLKHALGQEPDTSRLMKIRRDIARILTLRREKQKRSAL